jgi:tRNA-intron endonuclease
MPKKENIVKAIFVKNVLIIEESDIARELNNQNCFGNLEGKTLSISLMEGFYLLEKEKLLVLDGRNKQIIKEKYFKKAVKIEPNFKTRYRVFKDLRERGYVVKTALKFGADFRVYDRGIKPGEDHAKWVVFPVTEGETLTWHDFSAKNRVAHSTKKKLLMGIVDDENDVTYYEVSWVRP